MENLCQVDNLEQKALDLRNSSQNANTSVLHDWASPTGVRTLQILDDSPAANRFPQNCCVVVFHEFASPIRIGAKVASDCRVNWFPLWGCGA
jgi:hypothetical protein